MTLLMLVASCLFHRGDHQDAIFKPGLDGLGADVVPFLGSSVVAVDCKQFGFVLPAEYSRAVLPFEPAMARPRSVP